LTTPAAGAAAPTTREKLEELAAALARTHTPLKRAPLLTPRLADVPALGTAIAAAARAFRTTPKQDDVAYQKAGEWLLDNYYVCERALRQVKSELPSGFRRHLPHAGTDLLPRVLFIARALVRVTSLDLDEPTLEAFVAAYQAHSPLTVAELWALPTLMRLAVLEVLVQTLDMLLLRRESRQGQFDLVVDPALAVERCIRILRLLAEIDWKAFFAKSSIVESILREDPSKVYARMDFATCDTCRQITEQIAWGADVPEPTVARTAIAMAGEHPADPKRGHVGYYLLGPGRADLERRIGHRPRGVRVRARRFCEAHPTLTYLGLVGMATALLVAGFATATRLLAPAHQLLLDGLALVPLSSVAIAMVHAFLTKFLTPRTLPKLDFSEGIPPDLRTAVVIPALLAQPSDVDELLRQLEVHYLSHPDMALSFVLLVDHVDSAEKPDDAALLGHAEARLTALNQTYAGQGRGPFHLLYRESRWSPGEARFMGWERKRGKLEEFNRLLRGDTETSFSHRFGDPEGLTGIRFVITLDADTRLPLGAAHRLIGLLAHPLNQAEWDATGTHVVSGYTIVQPRVETSPLGGPSTWFSRMRAGDTAIDIYTRAVSDVYQDLFGAGIYVGKGIYDVDAFMKSLEGRVPENALASHDLFEGSHGRAALATDIVLFEEYPHNFLAFTRRQHRWIRGDWQLLPWLFASVPGAKRDERLPNVLGAIDRWKIFDNLRRSLLAPSLFALVAAGLFTLPQNLAVLALAPLLLPLFMALFTLGAPRWQEPLGRWALSLLSLPHDAWNAADAILRVLSRLRTRKHLLQWVTAAHTAKSLGKGSAVALFFKEMRGALVLVALLGAAILVVRPGVLAVVAPLLVAWLAAPELLRRASTPSIAPSELHADDRRILRRLARRTWLFFESFVGPADQWLPPDNFQEEPRGAIAHRTSPTNIGLLLIAELSAHDFGYIGPTELCLLLRQSFDTLLRLERYSGHWLNWYETRNLEPLLPRYVSTVDSGNLAASLVTLAGGCADAAQLPILGARRWDGLDDTLGLLEETALSVPSRTGAIAPAITAFRQAMERAGRASEQMGAALAELCDTRLPELERAVIALLDEGTGQERVAALRELRTWLERLRRQMHAMRRDWDTFLAWMGVANDAAAHGVQLEARVLDACVLSLDGVEGAAEQLYLELSAQADGAQNDADRAWLARALSTTTAARKAAREHREDLASLADRALAETRAMDFTFLYDKKRRLFHIGYNVTAARLDASYYDLFASEARVASFIAIVLKQVPVSHWFALGRPVTLVHGQVVLLSWGATMFEYLLPNVFMRSQEHTLLASSTELAVRAQIDYGRRCGTPWGISESGFAQLDAQNIYQYRSFGVPGLGLKRGLEDDLVIAPYASMLAVGLRPREVMQNLARLVKMRAMGTYGLYEAVDFRSPGTESLPEAADGSAGFKVVRSHMAHHQGMVLASLNNALHGDVLVERFHADALVQTGELLLNERLPSGDVAEKSARTNKGSHEPAAIALPSFPTWSPEATAAPEVALLTNGRLTTLVTDTGGGDTRYRGLAVSPACHDGTRDTAGTWIYVRDQESGELWSATPAPTGPRASDDHVSFAPHKVELHGRRNGVSMRTEICVAHLHDAEVRHVTLHNESDRRRELTLTSYLEPVLEGAASAARHPAFSRLFVECETVAELHGVTCTRRRKAPEDASLALVHRAVWDNDAVRWGGSATDRAAFVGRRRDVQAPAMGGADEVPPERKAPLDPAVTLALDVTLEPGATVEVAFVTTVAPEAADAVEGARRFATLHAVRWAIRDAERECARRLHVAGVAPSLLPHLARLVSRLLFPLPFYGASRDTRRAFSPAQPQLWGHGISGDDPVLVVRVADPEATTLVDEVLATYRYLRACGVPIEVVFLDQTASGYQAEQAGNVRNFLIREGAAGWLHQRSGLFVLAVDQLGADETRRIEAAAQVVLDAHRGPLAEQWSRVPSLPPPLPAFTPTSPPQLAPEAARAPLPPLLFGHELGGFSADGREYVVLPHGEDGTPAPWGNVLANPELGCLVSESSLGCTWAVNAGENRLTPWRNDPVSDTPSEVLYLRDEETAELWTPTPLPAGRGAEVRVRHGAGYTVYERTCHGLVQELTVFVPADQPVKLLRLRVKNLLPHARRITATHYVEWALGPTRAGARSRVLCEFDADAQCLLARSAYDPQFEARVAFVSADRPLHGFTCDRTEFLGRSGGYASPAALARWGLAGTTEPGIDPCATLQVHLELGAGEETTVHFALGQGKDRATALELVRHFKAAGNADAALARMHEHWDDLLGAVQVKTPEPAMDLLLNRWLLYQSMASRFFARAAFYQSSGAFGFRDQLQDVMAFVHAAPAIARAHILLCAAHQFEEGDVLHWWHPPADTGVRTRCSDDYLWLPYVTAHYVEATGDLGILKEEVPFLHAKPLDADEGDRYAKFPLAEGTAPLLEHCRRAVARGYTEGLHGLPLIGSGDWNDGMSRVGIAGHGESVWLAWFVIAVTNAFVSLCERAKSGEDTAAWKVRAERLRQATEESAWDGAWYMRAFYDDGAPVGTSRARSCRIDSIAQSWSVLSGAAEPARARRAMRSAEELLVREKERLVLLLTPAFTGIRHDPGYIQAYPPGVRENGGQYTHAATWLGWAHARLGDGAAAERIFRLLSPIHHAGSEAAIALYRVEPYVIAADVYDAPGCVGRGGWTWYTGAAAWTWRLGVEAILGITRIAGGVKVDPCIPPSWPGFEATVRVGKKTLRVRVENPDGVARNVKTITLDGVPLSSNVVVPPEGGPTEHDVRVTLGAPEGPHAADDSTPPPPLASPMLPASA
jgi:cyclic beta-1,2-glucan synthetase